MNYILNASDLMSRNVATVSKDRSLKDAIEIMQQQKLSSIVVSEGLKPVGILTERDITKLALSPQENIIKKVDAVMSAPVVCVDGAMDYKDAYLKMREANIRHLVVIDEHKAIEGVISESDFLYHLNTEQLMAIKEVSKVMSKEVITCSPSTTLKEAIEILVQKRVGSIIVEENNKALGIVSEKDTINFINREEDFLSRPIVEYMSSPVITIHRKQSVVNAQEMMKQHHIRRLIVVGDSGEMEGIITRYDMIKNVPQYYVKLLKDVIEEQKVKLLHANDSLRSKTLLQHALQSLSYNMVVLFDASERVNFSTVKPHRLCKFSSIVPHQPIDSLEHRIFALLRDEEAKQKAKEGEIAHQIITIKQTHDDKDFVHICSFDTNLSAIFDEEGAFSGFLFIARDITSKEQFQEELIESEARYKRIFDASPTGIVYYDQEGTIIDCNERLAKTFHTDVEQLIGCNLFELIDNSAIHEAIEASLRNEEQRHSGWYTPFKWHGKAYFRGIVDCDSQVRRGVGLIEENTKERLAQENLHLYRRALKAVNEAVVMVLATEELPVVFVNPAFEQLTGYKRRELSTLSLLHRFEPKQPALQKVREAIKTRTSLKVRLRNFKKDGTAFLNELQIEPILGDSGAVTHFIGTLKEVK